MVCEDFIEQVPVNSCTFIGLFILTELVAAFVGILIALDRPNRTVPIQMEC